MQQLSCRREGRREGRERGEEREKGSRWGGIRLVGEGWLWNTSGLS